MKVFFDGADLLFADLFLVFGSADTKQVGADILWGGTFVKQVDAGALSAGSEILFAGMIS